MTAPADEGVTDMRNDLARARDDWMTSEDGRRMSEPLGICVPPRFSPYLRNRLEAAFIAGWNAREALPVPPQSGESE